MYAIYEQKGEQVSLFDEQDEAPMDLNEAEERLRQLRQDDPVEYGRIANLRDGIRTGKVSSRKGTYAFFRAGRYQQLVLLDSEGKVASRELSKALEAIACPPGHPARPLPPGYNVALMQAKARFDGEVKHLRAQRDYVPGLGVAQRYVLRELRVLFGGTKDGDIRHDIATMEQAFRQPLTEAIRKELNLLRRNGVTGETLLSHLKRIYLEHGLKDGPRDQRRDELQETPRIVCSEAFV
jgi:hypothetical protein